MDLAKLTLHFIVAFVKKVIFIDEYFYSYQKNYYKIFVSNYKLSCFSVKKNQEKRFSGKFFELTTICQRDHL